MATNLRNLLTFLFLLTGLRLFASDIMVEGVEWVRNDPAHEFKVKFTLSWNNSWHNDRNHDAAWVFFKYASPSYQQAIYRHARISGNGHGLLVNHTPGAPAPAFEVPGDRVGLFIYPSQKYRGSVRWTIEVSLDTSIFSEPNFNPGSKLMEVYGIEMVKIPQGSFTLGDPDTAAYRNHALFVSDGRGRPAGLKRIESETDSIVIGGGKGQLYYHVQTPLYQGDQKGFLSATFPKGFDAFYIMKYETTQGQYAAFLNSIANAASGTRANFGGRDYYTYRGSIKLVDGKYVAGSPARPCNYISWDDACAYADWAGLRPMTELEFEKACRGNSKPLAHEYPWNTNSKTTLQRVVNKNDELVWLNDLNEKDLNDQNRDQFGASYYWVMDLAGSLWERCVTIGDSVGRAFKGTHGDGNLHPYGYASNADWPKGSTETAGFGFRGGGYYEHNMQYGGFNPHSPIAYRNFGAWPGGARSLAYSSRFVRTALSAPMR
jgi:formylglycine-generating enzyme required for sulfatase activity